VNSFIKRRPGPTSSSPAIDATQEEEMMMRFTGLTVLAGSLVAASFMVAALPAAAQSDGCGPAAYSNEQQRYVGLPCTPKADTTASPCGPAAYSNADQKYTGLPCTPPTKKVDGKAAPCGPAAYSNADQTYVGMPCTH
jgi:hypothetical protein